MAALSKQIKLALTVFGCLSIALPSYAAVFKQAKLTKFVNGNEVFINGKRARVSDVARINNTVGTGKSRAALLFDTRAIGHLNSDSKITIGKNCFEIDEGTILVNGTQKGCAGKAIVGTRTTTYVLSRISEDSFRLSVLNGEAVLSGLPRDGEPNNLDPETELEPEFNILSRYPRFAPIFGIGASAYTSNSGGVSFGEASALVLGDVNFYLPLYQSSASRVLYSYTSLSSNFDGFWGASSELGYRWYSPARKSSQGIFVGYDGIKDPECFHSQIALGAEYNVSRWQFGVNGGIRADDCESSLSYAMAQVGIPLAQMGENTVRLQLAPYLMTGLGNDYLGGRVGVSVPLSNQLSLSAYGQYDRLFDTVIGGGITYRIGASNNFIKDPNLSPNPMPGANISSTTPPPVLVSTLPAAVDYTASGDSLGLPGGLAMDASGGGLVAQAPEGEIVKAGEEITFDGEGQVISRTRMSRARFQEVVESNMEGQDLLPEALAIFQTYKLLYGQSTPSVMAVTGAQWLFDARNPYPRLRAPDTLVVPRNRLPEKQVDAKKKNPPQEPQPPTPPEPPGYDPREDLPNQIVELESISQ
jgi:hypothetical protein